MESRTRLLTRALYTSALFSAAAAQAQTPSDPIFLRGSASVPAYVEYDKKVRAAEQLSPLGGELFGEDVSLYTGATEFSHVDIDIPGNNALPVQLRRRFTIGALVPDQAHDVRGGPGNAFGGLGNWDIEVPYVYGTFDGIYGWNIPLGADTQQPRCTQQFKPRKTVPQVSIQDVWSGNKVHIPGRGDKEILRLDASYPPMQYPTDGRAPTWSTSEFDAFTCTPHAAVSNGEGFVMTTPDGITYTFDVYRERVYASVEAGGHTNARKVVYLLASTVADRYGNTVTYTYDDIGRPTLITGHDRDSNSSSDRVIRLTYDATMSRLLTSASVTVGIPGQSSQTRTWRYAYENGADGLPKLKTVTLPDNVSQWTFDYNYNAPGNTNPIPDDYLYVDYVPPDTTGSECAAATFHTSRFSLRITHPSGANGDFVFGMGRQARTVPQPNCPTGGGQYLKTPYVDTYSLKSKTISDTDTSSSTWTYAPGGGACTRCTNTVVTQPANSGSMTYRFSNVYAATQAGTTPAGSAIEGQLLETITRDPNNVELRRVANTYVTGVDLTGAPLAGYPFPARYGLGGGGDDPSSGSVRPLKSVVTTQQGVTFTRTHKTFDTLARPLEIERSSTLGTKTETTVYQDYRGCRAGAPTPCRALWVLGLVDTLTNDVLPLNAAVDNLYDDVGNLTQVKAFGRLERSMSWNADGTLATVTEGPNTTTLGAFKRGIPTSVTYADNRSRSASIDDAGDIRSVKNELNEVTSYGYDALRRLTSITYPASDTMAWYPTTIQYERVGSDVGVNGTHWKQTTTTGSAEKVTHYDQRMRPVVTTESDVGIPSTQRHVRRNYDYAGRERFVSYPSATASTSAGTTTTYDALGRVIGTSRTSELGNLTTRTHYDPGFKTRFVNARAKTTTTQFQAFDEPDESSPIIIEAPEDVRTTIGRDVFGKPTTMTRSNAANTVSATRSYVYDEYQRLCKTIEPESDATVRAYNSANLVEWTASGQSLMSMTSCQQGSVPANQKISHQYDARERLLTTTYGDGSPNVERTYTADGLLETISSDNSQWTTTYNKRRLSTGETLRLAGVDYPIGYTHSRNGHVASMRYPDGTTVAYAPNALGEATQVGDYATQIVTHPNGALAGFVYGNGIAHTTEQNDRGLPGRSSDAGVLKDSYAYDANGNVTRITDELDNRQTRALTYDDLDRLRTADGTKIGGLQTFGYDALDNLRTTAKPGGTWTNHYDARQRLARIHDGTNNLVSYTWDSRGRVATRAVGQSTLTFTTDLADRVTQVAPNLASYRYDGHGRRTMVTKGGVTTVQVYSQAGQLVYQSAPVSDIIFRNGFEGSQSSEQGGTRRYVYLGRHLIAEDGTHGRKYLHTDALGSPVRTTTSGASTATERLVYQPYGWGPPANSTPGYTGHVADAETGLSYMQARYYDPFAARFLAPDPVVASEESFNRYWYANNNPYKNVDPDGRLPVLIPVAIFVAKELAGETFEQATGLPAPTIKGVGKAVLKQALKHEGRDLIRQPLKRGPKTDPSAPHNAAIRKEADRLEAEGNEILGGGGRLPERAVPTPDGMKSSRRPDILYKTPNDEVKGTNVGRTQADGTPVKREVEAMEDLNRAGVDTNFVPYEKK